MDLDARDRKLVCLLDQNARRPLSHLSRQLRISKQAARQRVMKMRSAGIISSPYALINAFALGRIWGRLWIRLQMAGPGVESRMLEFAKAQKNISWAVSCSGAYDFLVIYWSESISDFKKSADEFLYRFSGYIKDHDLSFITAGHDFSLRALSPDVGSVESLVMEAPRVELDGKDKKILSSIAGNADLSALEIGKKTGLDPKTVYYRMRRLEESGVILNYRLKVDFPRIGCTWYKFFLTFSNPKEKRIREMMAHLRTIPELIYITEAVGPSDLEFEIVVPTRNRMQEILLEVRNAFSDLIKDYKYLEVREVSVIKYFPE